MLVSLLWFLAGVAFTVFSLYIFSAKLMPSRPAIPEIEKCNHQPDGYPDMGLCCDLPLGHEEHHRCVRVFNGQRSGFMWSDDGSAMITPDAAKIEIVK